LIKFIHVPQQCETIYNYFVTKFEYEYKESLLDDGDDGNVNG
jgi:hypothetical protein